MNDVVKEDLQAIAVKHQDKGESRDLDYQERDDKGNQVNEEVQDKDYGNHDNNNYGDAYEKKEEVEIQERKDYVYEQGAYQDGLKDQDGIEGQDGVEGGEGVEGGLGQYDKEDDEQQSEDFSKEMAKLDAMENNRNARVLSKTPEGDDENADEAEIEEKEGEEGEEGEKEGEEYQYEDDLAQNGEADADARGESVS